MLSGEQLEKAYQAVADLITQPVSESGKELIEVDGVHLLVKKLIMNDKSNVARGEGKFVLATFHLSFMQLCTIGDEKNDLQERVQIR